MSDVIETSIDPNAIVSANAELGEGVTVGPGAIIEAGAKVGDGCIIGSNALIAKSAILAENVKVHHGAVVGTDPQDLKFGDEETTMHVGAGTVIREYATLNRGTAASGETRVGKNCLLMAYSHVAHDTQIGNEVILANAVQMGGHVVIEDCAIVGGTTAVHQFVHIGQHAMIGGGYRVPQDVCPYALLGGYPLRISSLNLIGLRRRGFKREALRALEAAYKLLLAPELNTSQAVERIKGEIEQSAEVKNLLTFIENSTRGLIK